MTKADYIFYKHIMVIFDEDHDERVLKFIDSIPEYDRNDIISVAESEGMVDIVWSSYGSDGIHRSLRDKDSVDVYIDGAYADTWNVEHEYICGD